MTRLRTSAITCHIHKFAANLDGFLVFFLSERFYIKISMIWPGDSSPITVIWMRLSLGYSASYLSFWMNSSVWCTATRRVLVGWFATKKRSGMTRMTGMTLKVMQGYWNLLAFPIPKCNTGIIYDDFRKCFGAMTSSSLLWNDAWYIICKWLGCLFVRFSPRLVPTS